MLAFLVLLGGLALLLLGGDLLVRGASGLARTFGVSPLVVGLTLVAFGTSAPELAVNVLAALRGSSTIAFGNVVGSNFANLGLILGLTVMLRPLQVHGTVIVREIPMMLLATLVMLVMALDGELRGEAAQFDRAEGLILLLLFGVFLYTAIGDVLRKRRGDALLREAEGLPPELPVARGGPGLSAVLVVVGLVALIGGGELTVAGARDLAVAAGLPESLIAFTLVAVGTSLPELATSLVAARRGETDIAIGNLVGSNIFNVLFILGTTAVVRPCVVPAAGLWDIGVLTGLSVLVLPFAATGARRLGRGKGAVLFLVWLGYTAWRVLAA